ncbi:MAG: carbon-nitrogen hydrolase family protein [Candidatus Odinarchaeota archaeon]
MSLKVAALQVKIVAGQVEKNLERVSGLVEEALASGKGVTVGTNPYGAAFGKQEDQSSQEGGEMPAGELDVLVLPEYFSGALPGTSDEKLEQVPECLKELAKEIKGVVAGSTLWSGESGKLSNRCFVFGAKGEKIGSFLKQKLFKREIAYGFEAGNQFFKFDHGEFKTGIAICNDVWWPEAYREELKECHLVLIPLMSSVDKIEYIQYGRLTWWNLAMTRSKENVQYLVAADHAAGTILPGQESGPATCGAAMITNPWTRKMENVAKAIPDGREGLLVGELTIDELMEYREYRKRAGML